MNGFYGSAFGNILGTLYFLLFQCVGFLYIKRIFPKKGLLFHLLTGSVSGSVLLQWIPALFAFFFGFSMTAHIMALLFVVISLVLLYVFYHPATAVSSTAPTKDYRQLLRRNYAFLLLAGGTFVLFCILLSTHTILPKNDGSVLMGICRCTWESLQVLPINRPSLLTTPSLPGIGSAILSCATVFLPVFTCLVHPCAMLICSLCILLFSRS